MNTMKKCMTQNGAYRLILPAFLALLLSVSVGTGQTLDSRLIARLQNTLDSLQTAEKIKGISASVLIPDQGLWSGASGVSHQNVPIRTDMLFGIGSNTKTFTAALLLKLQEEGVINLDDAIGNWIPAHKHINPAITVRQLLNHTSGLFDYPSSSAYRDSILSDPNRIWQPEELLQFVGPPFFSAGESWRYSNTNYLLAGMIAKAVTHEKLSTLFRRFIFDPLQLDSTFLSVEEELEGDVAHRWMGGVDLFNVPISSAFSGAWAAGAMFSTSKEMAQWTHALLTGQVINEASLKQMKTFVGPRNYGLGIIQKTLSGRTVLMHSGEIRGYSSIVVYDTVLHVSISVLINQAAAPAQLIAEELLRIIASSSVVSVRDDTLNGQRRVTNFLRRIPLHQPVGDRSIFHSTKGANHPT